ncbi:hypothetical protein OHV05_35565 (plasmid) [Kitasatospora sp. NBC_00070]|uniref:hypothetical protein n=1 Tax=Kitasatospora sp. NBC_00070 TaxID=2975962 RepID=UPI002F908690
MTQTNSTRGGASEVTTATGGNGRVVIKYTIANATSFGWSNSQRINSGDSYTVVDGSGNAKFRLGMQGDGHLVLHNGAWQLLWASNTGGSTGAYATIDNGVIKIMNAAGTQTLWNSLSQSSASTDTLNLTSTDALTVNSSGGSIDWLTANNGVYTDYTLPAGTVLSYGAGGYSVNRQLVMQYDGSANIGSAAWKPGVS